MQKITRKQALEVCDEIIERAESERLEQVDFNDEDEDCVDCQSSIGALINELLITDNKMEKTIQFCVTCYFHWTGTPIEGKCQYCIYKV